MTETEGKRRDIADELRELLNAEDGRTIEEIRAAEPSYEFTVEKIDSRNETHTFVYVDGDGLCAGFSRPDVKEGDVVTVWDGHATPLIGSEKHGWALNGQVVEWLTPWERVSKRVAWLADHDRKQREEFAERQGKLDADYEALPQPLKARIDRFRAKRPSFRVDSETYELFACVEAAKIADHLRPRVEAGADPAEVVKEFHDLPWEQQSAVVDDGHSGNTFGSACAMARALLAGEAV